VGGADVVLWIGPMLERPLAGLVEDLDATVVTVQNLSGLELINVDGQPDPHVWIDTRNARLIAANLAAALAELDPANAERYRENLSRLTTALTTLDTELTQAFTGAATQDWAVYHHALRYLEREFQLPPPLMLADSENNAPGIRTARQVRAQLEAKGITCMLIEPGVNRDEVSTMLGLPALQLVEADVMGRGADLSSYATYMRALGATVGSCLGLAP
jgi:zinc transport system substrate-binding protein